MLLAALIDLSSGLDVVLVGVDRAAAVEHARRLLRLAKALGVPCQNIPGLDLDGSPRVRIRGFEEVVGLRAVGRTAVHIDHEAVFEHGVVREPAVRSVPV